MKRKPLALATGLLLSCGLPLLPGHWHSAALAETTAAEGRESAAIDLTDTRIENLAAYITSQCYTKTEDAAGRVHNPCFTCHTRGQIPTYLDDSDLQESYSLPGDALHNPWTNLFVDRGDRVAAIGDAEILQYVRTDNYLTDAGRIALAETLSGELPANWDLQGDGRWDGYIPDAYFAFDDQGFDRDPSGAVTGWRAFAYYPFPGTFWPTNGSTDDVLIRLSAPFRETRAGHYDPLIYKINLAIVEAVVRRQDIAIDPVDEHALGVDLDKDGQLGEARVVTYDWAPLEQRFMSYVGRAGELQQAGRVHLAAGLFPEGTEFLHSVRYIDLDETDTPRIASRMKELRYAIKASWYTYTELKGINTREGAERALDADILKSAPGDYERGMFTQGWLYQGFIEDRDGNLRPQSQEETLFCMGCHGGIGATTDTIFSFPRRFAHDAFQQGWYHWTQQGIVGVPEPRLPDGGYEYSRYLEVNGAGDEFRANTEVMGRFFDEQGELRQELAAALHDDISLLLLPSAARALSLDKAYRVIVEEQSFARGRDATIHPPANVHESVIQDQPTGVTQPEL